MVKKLCLFFFACTLLFYISACKNSNAPESVSEKFLISFSKMDYQTAKSLSTRNTWEMLDIMAAFTKNMPEESKTAISEHLKIKITDTKKETDSTVIITYQSEPKILPFNKLRLLKTVDMDGRTRWKVDISTLDLVGGEEMYIEEENKPVFDDEASPADSAASAPDSTLHQSGSNHHGKAEHAKK